MQRAFRVSLALRSDAARSTIPADRLTLKLREALKASMRERNTPKSNALKSILGDLDQAGKSKTVVDTQKTLRKAIATRLDAKSKVQPQSDLHTTYFQEIGTLREFLEDDERAAMDEADKMAAEQSSLPMTELLRDLQSKFAKRLDGQIIRALARQAEGQ